MSKELASTRREVVGIFSRRDGFDQAVRALLAEGFGREDLSVLASHASLDATLPEKGWRERLAALPGELQYEGPLVTAGLIAVAAGPVGQVFAGLIAAGLGGAVLKELMEPLTARPHAAEFARAVTAGSIILWVDVGNNDDREVMAADTLFRAGAVNVHANTRAA
jgi:hypothetical protein